MKRRTIYIVSLIVVNCVPFLLDAAPVSRWMKQANGYYEAGTYDSAAALYQRIIDAGVENPAVYYNLGNTYYRLNKKGHALYAYEKARRLAPHDPDIEANIRYVNMQITDKMPPRQTGFLEEVLWRLHSLFSLHMQLWLLFGLLMVLSTCISMFLFASHTLRLWIGYSGSLVLLVTCAMGISAGYKIYKSENTVEAIVLSKSVDARSEPRGDNILFTAHEGAKFMVRKQMDTWALVSLPNGAMGWVESDSLGML